MGNWSHIQRSTPASTAGLVDPAQLADGVAAISTGGGAKMAKLPTAAGFLVAEKSFRKLRGFEQMQTLIDGLRPNAQPIKKGA